MGYKNPYSQQLAELLTLLLRPRSSNAGVLCTREISREERYLVHIATPDSIYPQNTPVRLKSRLCVDSKIFECKML